MSPVIAPADVSTTVVQMHGGAVPLSLVHFWNPERAKAVSRAGACGRLGVQSLHGMTATVRGSTLGEEAAELFR